MLSVNLRHLENRNLSLRGELSVSELDLDTRDEMIRVTQPVRYDFEIERLNDALLIQGKLQATLDCECVRCLKKFERELELNSWTLHLPLEGEDAVAVDNDCVDLTPFVREDILLEFPQHPLCKPDCGGLKKIETGKVPKTTGKRKVSPAWAELNKLKL
ncbi:MAG: YceD family protein [Limisphaerales bacterium]